MLQAFHIFEINKVKMLSSFLSKNIFLARILPFLALGIIIGFRFPTEEILPYLISLLFIYFAYTISKNGILVSLFFSLLGFILIQEKLNHHCYSIDNETSKITANIISSIKENEQSNSFIIETKEGLRVKLYYTKNSDSLQRGDKIVFNSKLKEIENYSYSSFNYKKYMKSLYCRYYSYTDNIQVLSHNGFKNPVLRISNSIHNKINSKLKNSELSNTNSSLISAMLIGERSEIDNESKKEYIDAGAIHILAISGLHIGIIFLVISFILTRIFRINERSLSFLIICLISLWAYAFLTFLPSSVLRASLIISFILISKYIKREACIYNSIGASAFIILLIDPAALLSPGFQLSYAAYTSIIYFFPKIKSLVICKNKFLRNIWELFSLCLSAQIGTIVLTALHFGQIANYSILTNLLISVFLPIIIYTSLIWILAPYQIISYSLNTLIDTVNNIVSFISQLPAAVTYVKINTYEAISIYLIIISIFCMLWYKKRKLIWISLSSILLLNIITSIDYIFN